jgi:hypothetical protein
MFLQTLSMLFAAAELYTIDLDICFDGAPRALHVAEWSKMLPPWAIEY